jgi:hypothetical protein
MGKLVKPLRLERRDSVGSTPSTPTICRRNSVAECLSYKEKVVSSILTAGTIDIFMFKPHNIYMNWI